MDFFNLRMFASTQQDRLSFERLLGDGSKGEIRINYVINSSPNGLVQAVVLGRKFIDNYNCILLLSDNIIYGKSLREFLVKSIVIKYGCVCLPAL